MESKSDQDFIIALISQDLKKFNLENRLQNVHQCYWKGIFVCTNRILTKEIISYFSAPATFVSALLSVTVTILRQSTTVMFYIIVCNHRRASFLTQRVANGYSHESPAIWKWRGPQRIFPYLWQRRCWIHRRERTPSRARASRRKTQRWRSRRAFTRNWNFRG